ncbi:MAG: hypothetical protein GXO40_02155 [Epsilonproteobacteria bacterium]|nr:hypothetical protein [Campylobacterota bacterium]
MAQTLEFEGKTYDMDKLSKDAKVQLLNIQYVDKKIQDLKAEIATLNAARMFYIEQLKNHLPQE